MLKRFLNANRAARPRLTGRLAGLAAGARQTRRGSFLIMVVGTLALLAVITVVYVSIGRSDSQSSAAVVKQSDRDFVPHKFRDYVLGIMSDDVFDVAYLGERDANGDPIFRREAWDYPSAAYVTRLPGNGLSDIYEDVTVGGPNANAWFNPTGNLTGTDPWLASSEPTVLNIDRSAASENDPTSYWSDRVDLAQISMVSPDGAFVNLFNLRDNFDATPWELRGRNGPVGLSVLEASPESGGSRGNTLDFGSAARDMFDRNARPAEYGSRQRNLFYPMVDPGFGPRDAEYLPYQYADADGDGMLDARWFEMVLARDESVPDDVRWLISPDERLRYFFATRIVDLSGRVNVNTATDATLAPDATDPFGFTPASVDIRSILTLQDFYADPNIAFGYESHDQPMFGNGASEDYSDYDQLTAYDAGQRAYDGLRMLLDTGTMPFPGYDGLVTLGGGDIEREFSSPYWSGNPISSPTDYYEIQAGFGGQGGGGTSGSLLGRAFGADTLLDLLAFNGVNDDRVRSPLEVIMGGRSDGYLWLSPLRDNRSTSLERGGRFSVNGRQISMDDDALYWALTDIRQHLTSLSGARPLAPTVQTTAAPVAFGDADVKADIGSLFATGGAGPDGQNLFELYGDAFAPYSEVQAHWLLGGAQFETLYYGHRGPELAVRTAAHTAANMFDAYDENDRPLKRTVVLNGSQSFRSASLDPNGRDPLYPWQLFDLDPQGGTPRLANRQVNGMPDAVNIFGVEAQPFVIAAASYITYTDVPNSDGGDDDVRARRLNGIEVPTVPPSINGDPRHANVDVLFEVVAFHVHNPFDESITLTGDQSDPGGMKIGQMYLQYGDPEVHGDSSFIKLAKADFETRTELNETITLGPRESKVFYLMSGDPTDIGDRINRALDPDLADSESWVSGWINRQLGADAIRVTWCNPTTGQLNFQPSWNTDLSSTFTSLQGDPSLKSSTEDERRVIRMWRVEKPQIDTFDGGFPFNNGLDESSLNDVVNDTLVDRIRDPKDTGQPTLDRQLVEAENQAGRIDGADPGLESPPQNDNRGLTITRYGTISRRQDPSSSSGSVPRGGLPAYTIESKTGTDLQNLRKDDPSGTDDHLEIGYFNGAHAFDTLQQFIFSRTALVDVMKQEPWRWSQTAGDWSGVDPNIGPNIANVPFQGNNDYSTLRVEPQLNNEEFEVDLGNGGVSVMRLADLLLPLGIGPHQVPDQAYHGDDEDIEWTTLSESLALALYYDEPSNAQESVYFNAFDMPTTPDGTWGDALLATAHIRHDAFVPFVDVNANGIFEADTDVRWGLGVPMAATIFDFATTIPREFGALASPTPGQINVNTASRVALRALPGLSPPPTTGPDGTPIWWWTGGEHNAESDIATTVATYRDRNALHPRSITGGGTTIPLDFRDGNADGNWDSAGSPPGVDPDDDGRLQAVGVTGIREEPGIRSLGEIALARNWLHPGSTNLGYPYAHDIDRLGFDDDNLDRLGVFSGGYDTDGNDIPDEDDEIVDDHDERLALTNGVLNSASVRSDYFACWFLVHGYQESDVKNLRPEDPMVPTVARRFLMVVDRSNVVSPGQRPRVVLFKEVPL